MTPASRRVARGQILSRAAQAARRAGRLEEFRELVERVFDGTSLSDYVDLLEKSP